MTVGVDGERRKSAVIEKKGGHMIANAKAIKKVSFLGVLLVGLIVSVISVGGCHWGHNHHHHYYPRHR
jgi:hypothetical protein